LINYQKSSPSKFAAHQILDYNPLMTNNYPAELLSLAQFLLDRLEKISADSPWAHRASGVRASLAKWISTDVPMSDPSNRYPLDQLIKLGFDILEQAAGEIPEDT
jgi:hypothetical protein